MAKKLIQVSVIILADESEDGEVVAQTVENVLDLSYYDNLEVLEAAFDGEYATELE